MLNKSIFLTSNTNIRQDGKVHSYCGLRLTDIPTAGAGTSSASKYAHTRNEIRNRMSAFMSKEAPETVDKNIVANLIQMLLSERTTTRQYNAPTVSEVSALIINDFGDGLPIRDIVVNKNNTGPQRILELHPSYMALQYPLLFPFGEDGYHENIPHNTNKGTRKTKRRLFEQYLVDAFTAIEEQRLNWTRNNQDMLRVDLYHNLCDAVTRGDTSAAGLGKRIFLPRTYVGSPRYMMHNYQDIMALCRTYGNPDLFITFTSNPKWLEIAEMLAYISGQKSHDRPEIGTRVFKMKLIGLLEDLTKHYIFGKYCAVPKARPPARTYTPVARRRIQVQDTRSNQRYNLSRTTMSNKRSRRIQVGFRFHVAWTMRGRGKTRAMYQRGKMFKT
ncbi:helicase [Tanacetum coccineum]